ncbi:uncharacterized protein LOC132558055 [Ylistrum balloti]|uniref:uncharacterized protein LOC132558055 n=1 Tax=Ylistrum balloti TaxID=509963 RepID=UPI002905E418|nr:uncharacterized protein LOC132558055 [Ylistrum balloti]
MMNILNFTEAPMKDESIEEYEHHEYDPITDTNLNNPGELRINIEAQDLFTHPSESYLIIEGRLTKTDGTAYANDDNVTLTNNALMYLFSNIKYQLSGQEIESLFHPGQGTTMLGLLKYPDDFSKSQGLNQLWYKDTSAAASAAAAAGNAGFSVRQSYIIKSPDPKGTFSFRVPLKHIFGFCEDYDKIVYGMKQTLTLVRKTDNDAIFRNANVDDGKITLEKVSWFMPHVLPADADKFQLYKTLDSNALLPVMYRIRECDSTSVPQSTSFTWRLSVKSAPERPRHIIVGFQTDKDGDQEQNPSIFDNVNVRNIFVMLNSARYPAVDYNLSFPKQQFSRAYGDAAAFRSKFYNMYELVSNPNITPADYKTLFPLFVLDVSKQSERLKTAVTDIHIKMQFNANVPAGTEAFAVVISDKMINFKTDGKKVNVVYS